MQGCSHRGLSEEVLTDPYGSVLLGEGTFQRHSRGTALWDSRRGSWWTVWVCTGGGGVAPRAIPHCNFGGLLEGILADPYCVYLLQRCRPSSTPGLQPSGIIGGGPGIPLWVCAGGEGVGRVALQECSLGGYRWGSWWIPVGLCWRGRCCTSRTPDLQPWGLLEGSWHTPMGVCCRGFCRNAAFQGCRLGGRWERSWRTLWSVLPGEVSCQWHSLAATLGSI